jgi:predicted nucleic acid-binding protein
MYLFDTDVVSALRRRDRVEKRVVNWVDRTAATDQFLSSMTLFELELGALQVRHRDEVQGSMFINWIRRRVLPNFSGRILPFDAPVALRCAALHVPNPRPAGDAVIAATALEHGLTVVTRNVRDFVPMGVPYFNPWTDS